MVIEDDVIVGGQAGFAGIYEWAKVQKSRDNLELLKALNQVPFSKATLLSFQLAQRISVLQRKLPDLFNRFAQENSKD